MLAKIGLPPKPSMRGAAWVPDGTHCQGCNSQFTFINRKHHCRRCGGLFCNSCTSQRMVLRGQGDSPVRICDPCKKLEEAARFEMRNGRKRRTIRAASKFQSEPEDEILNQLMESDSKRPSSSGHEAGSHTDSDQVEGSTSTISRKLQEDHEISDDTEGVIRSITGVQSSSSNEMDPTSPEELRKQAAEEYQRYKVLKAQGKSDESLLAFKRRKELERQAGALELTIRKNRRLASIQNSAPKPKDDAVGEKRKVPHQASKTQKEDLTSELRNLGWCDDDLDADKKTEKLSLEGELSNIIRETPKASLEGRVSSGVDKSQVVAHKRRALALKREGKLAEAKEELKQAKLLEKKLEEQELLGGMDESDDEISALIRSMDNDKDDELSLPDVPGHGINFDPSGLGDEIALECNLDVTEEDMNNPEMASALKSFGWSEDDERSEKDDPQFLSFDHEKLSAEVFALKKEAVIQKRAGNTSKAMELLKQAKVLERDLENLQSGGRDPEVTSVLNRQSDVEPAIKRTPRSKRVIQKELLALKKRALRLRREGQVEEADEELKKGKLLEQELEEADNETKHTVVRNDTKKLDAFLPSQDPSDALNFQEEADEDVTDQDMNDPAILSVLENLGWKEEAVESANFQPKPETISVPLPTKRRRSKADIQRELLGIKRKAFTLRRQGKSEEAEEELKKAKDLENQLADMEVQHPSEYIKTNFVSSGPSVLESKHESLPSTTKPPIGVVDEGNHRSSDLSGSPASVANKLSENDTSPPHLPLRGTRSKSQIQKDLLSIKRKVLALRRQGNIEEVDEELRKEKDLEDELAEMEVVQQPTVAGASDAEKLIAEIESSKEQEAAKRVMRSPQSSPPTSLVDPFIGGVQTEVKSSDEQHLTENMLGGSEQRDPVGPRGYNLRTIRDTPADLAAQQLAPLSSQEHAFGVKDETQEKPSKDVLVKENKLVHEFDSLKDQILASKRKAIALKREGKLAEARDELRKAKILEKKIEEENQQASLSAGHHVQQEIIQQPQIPVPSISSIQSVKQDTTQERAPQSQKPLSGRDRFKIQQESLAHKRRALKLRREGKFEESEAESELAKKLEAQIEELDCGQNASKVIAESDDGSVEDLLDPQLMSALKAIGLADMDIVKLEPSKVNNKPDTDIVKAGPSKADTKADDAKRSTAGNPNFSSERATLEEQIKSEKLRALNLKRAGKQTEALDALRSAKRLEKKLATMIP